MKNLSISRFVNPIGYLAIVLCLSFVFSVPAYAANQWTASGLSNYSVASVAVDPSNASTLYAGTNGGGVFKSTDAGETWNAINNGLPDPSTLGYNTLVIDPSNTNVLYVASQVNALYKSTDGGANWTQINGLPSRVLDVVVDPTNDNVVYAAEYGNSCQPFYKSTDGGATWNSVALGGQSLDGCDGYRLLLDPKDHNTVYIGTDNGGHVFKSTDAGTTWSCEGFIN